MVSTLHYGKGASMKSGLVLVLSAPLLLACATPQTPPMVVRLPAQAMATPNYPPVPSVPTLKGKIAVGRFSNATNYGRALLLPGERDPLADQAADMLMA